MGIDREQGSCKRDRERKREKALPTYEVRVWGIEKSSETESMKTTKHKVLSLSLSLSYLNVCMLLLSLPIHTAFWECECNESTTEKLNTTAIYRSTVYIAECNTKNENSSREKLIQRKMGKTLICCIFCMHTKSAHLGFAKRILTTTAHNLPHRATNVICTASNNALHYMHTTSVYMNINSN